MFHILAGNSAAGGVERQVQMKLEMLFGICLPAMVMDLRIQLAFQASALGILPPFIMHASRDFKSRSELPQTHQLVPQLVLRVPSNLLPSQAQA